MSQRLLKAFLGEVPFDMMIVYVSLAGIFLWLGLLSAVVFHLADRTPADALLMIRGSLILAVAGGFWPLFGAPGLRVALRWRRGDL